MHNGTVVNTGELVAKAVGNRADSSAPPRCGQQQRALRAEAVDLFSEPHDAPRAEYDAHRQSGVDEVIHPRYSL